MSKTIYLHPDAYAKLLQVGDVLLPANPESREPFLLDGTYTIDKYRSSLPPPWSQGAQMHLVETTPAAETAPEPWVDATVVATHLDLHVNTICKMARAGKLRARRVRNGKNTLWRFQLSAVNAAVDAGETA